MSSFDLAALSEMPTEELARVAAECLAQLEPGRQPLELFTQLSRLMVLSTFEITPLRSSRKGTEVLLAQRPETDLWWPSQWHLPGSVQLPATQLGERSYDDAADSILATELKGAVTRTSPVNIFDVKLRTGVRGSEQAVLGWIEADLTNADVEPANARFFTIDEVLANPPEGGFVINHDQTVRNALAHYTSQRG